MNQLFDTIKKEAKKYRRSKYWSCTIFIAFLLVIVGIYLKINNPSYNELSNMLITSASSLIIAAIIQVIQNNSTQETLSGDISERIKDDISREVDKIREAKNLLTPETIYWGGESKFEKDLISCTRKSSTLKFMSISASHLLNKRLSNFGIPDDRASFTVQLLLLDPTDDDNLNYRAEQMKKYKENKDIENLKKEIIESVMKSCELCKECSRFNFEIRFHREMPLFRIEFPNENALFISYFDSQKSQNNLGPVARYGRDNDVFISIINYFNEIWVKNKESEIFINRSTDFNHIHNKLTSRFKSCDNIIDNIFSKHTENKEKDQSN